MKKGFGRRFPIGLEDKDYESIYAKLETEGLVEFGQDKLRLIEAGRKELMGFKQWDISSIIMVGDQFGEWFTKIDRRTAEHIRGAKFVVLKKAMDPSNLVNVIDFNREVLSFLEKASPEQRY